jgi:hypothetical protein
MEALREKGFEVEALASRAAANERLCVLKARK